MITVRNVILFITKEKLEKVESIEILNLKLLMFVWLIKSLYFRLIELNKNRFRLSDLIDIYELEKTCEYRGEIYHVRDNSSVLRCQKLNKRKRPLDEKWTFGKPCKNKGYMTFSSETVHRIVATAFHGTQPSEKHIVDHIDTNKKNNRPKNLRWVTRLENILLNPITLSRIIFKYGSIDNFLSNPSNPIDGELEQNFEWMRTVTKEESDNTRANLIRWAEQGKIPKGGSLGEWVFYNSNTEIEIEESSLSESITKNAIQKNWKTKSEFPKCPTKINDDSIEGIQHQTLPFFSVQFHPEAAPGPTDTYSLFKDFYKMVAKYE